MSCVYCVRINGTFLGAQLHWLSQWHSLFDLIMCQTLWNLILCLAKCLALTIVTGLIHQRAIAVPLLPDLFSWADEDKEYMYGGTFDLDSEPSRVLYRFHVAIPNQGDGPFEVFEVTHPNQTQDVYQHVYDDQGGFTAHLMGTFMIDEPPPFGHLHLEGLALYSLREVTAGNGVGPIVASQLKTSHGLVDSVAYDLGLTGAPQTRIYTSADDNPLGVSIGWADLYSKGIPTQRIDVTGVPSGQYWLEVEIDPNNIVQETDDTNNVTRILVDLTIPEPTIMAADFDEDTDVDHYDLETWEANLGNTDASHMEGDADADEDADGIDFLIWQRQYTGELVPPMSAVNTVPEPSGVCLLLLGVIGLKCRGLVSRGP